MNVYSELVKAQLENLASDPAPVAGAKGRIYHKSTTEPIKIDDGTTIHTVVTDQNINTIAAFSLPSTPIITGAGAFTQSSGNITAGTYGLNLSGVDVRATAGSSAAASIYVDSSGYPADIFGKTPKFQIKATLHVNDVAPGCNFTLGLFPTTRPATSGTSASCTFTLGTVVPSSNGAAFTTPAVDTSNYSSSDTFTIPANGHYVIGVTTSGTISAANSFVFVQAQLMLVYV
jgi:hypothetical protein